MDSDSKIIDKFQITGFILSAIISIMLIVTKQDTIASVSLGLILAVLTQLFDLQIRQSASEERLIKAIALTPTLYRDEWLFKNVQQIVSEYGVVKCNWFKLFRLRASDAIKESKNVLHSMAEGYMIVESHSRYSFGSDDFRTAFARKFIKAVAATDASYWKSRRSEDYFQASVNAVHKGVSITRIFVYPQETLCEIVDELEKQRRVGIEVYVANPCNIPQDLYEDYLIMDDKLSVLWEFNLSGHLRHEKIMTAPVDVEKMVWKFNMLLTYSHKLDNVIDNLRQEKMQNDLSQKAMTIGSS
jgi:hypothetical protein